MKWRKWEPEHAEKAHEMRRSLPFAWGAFEKALKRRGCPVCQVLREWEQRSLFSFLYEGMMSPPFCQKFLDGGGFCARHFFMVTHLGTNFWSVGAFEVANLCVPLVAKAIMGITRSAKSRSKPRAGLLFRRPARSQPIAPGHGCIFCLEIRDTEQGLIGVLEKLADEEDFGRQISANGLCLRHGRKAMESWKQASKRGWLQDLMLRHAVELAGDLKEFIRKHEHRYRQEAIGREADAVRRTMEFLIGLESQIPCGKAE